MRDTVYFLVFEGYADWQAALALCEIRRPGDWQVRAVGFDRGTVRSMGGVRVCPDLAVAELDPAQAAMLIVPGGHLWRYGEGERVAAAVARLHAAGAVVAGIDTGVLPLARAGLLDTRRHTASWPGQIGGAAPHYRGHACFDADALAVGEGGTITAGYLGHVEFAREVIASLALYAPAEREQWYGLFRHARHGAGRPTALA